MKFQEFKTQYEIQIALGVCIDKMTMYEYPNTTLLQSIVTEADKIGQTLGNTQHWEIEPMSTEDAFAACQKAAE